MTGAAARVLDLRDHGVLPVGKQADIKVLDPDGLAERQPTVVRDFRAARSR